MEIVEEVGSSISEEMNYAPTGCIYTPRKGKSANSPCGKPCLEGRNYCKGCISKNLNRRCIYILSKGPKAGTSCGKTCLKGKNYCGTCMRKGVVKKKLTGKN